MDLPVRGFQGGHHLLGLFVGGNGHDGFGSGGREIGIQTFGLHSIRQTDPGFFKCGALCLVAASRNFRPGTGASKNNGSPRAFDGIGQTA